MGVMSVPAAVYYCLHVSSHLVVHACGSTCGAGVRASRLKAQLESILHVGGAG